MKNKNSWDNEYQYYVQQNEKEETLGIIVAVICVVIFIGPFVFGTIILILAHFGLLF